MEFSKERFILGLIRSHLVTFGDVVTTSHGHTNPYYLDLRAIYSYPDLLRAAVNWLIKATHGETYEFVCGIETASLPLVGAYGFATAQPTLYLRTKQKPYGKQKVIEGHFRPGDRVILVDDLIVEPEITLDFIRLAESAGVTVVGLYVLYEKLAHYISRDVFEKAGYPVKSIFTFNDLAEIVRTHHKDLACEPRLADLITEFGSAAHSTA